MQIEQTASDLIIEVQSEAETDRLGRVLAGLLQPNTVVGLIGPLGAGKTRLVRAISEALGVDPNIIASPTFGLIHEYEGALPIYHFDTYRLASPEDFEALGPEEYWRAGGVCLVEWADKVRDFLPADAWILTITSNSDGRRFSLDTPASIQAAVVNQLQT